MKTQQREEFSAALKKLKDSMHSPDEDGIILVIGSLLTNVQGDKGEQVEITSIIGGDIDIAHMIRDRMVEDEDLREVILHAADCFRKNHADLVKPKRQGPGLLEILLEGLLDKENRPTKEDMAQDQAVMQNPENKPQKGESKSVWLARVLPKFSKSGAKQVERLAEALFQ